MAKIAFILASDFEDVEFTHPYEAASERGHDTTVIGIEAGQELSGKRGDATVTTDAAVGDVAVDDFDALVIPGGYSPDKLRLSDDATQFTRKFVETGKPVAAICHAGQLLVEAGVVEGKTLTSWPSVRTELQLAGAHWVDQEVVEDDNLITSRNPDDLDAFTSALLDRLS
ncbi:MAG: type 1 glutamine amidotransferase domain-containing protein [Nitriliruptorales bacterium]|nr:type 1 glutamine amidotransferase domain-containing protein [Nitriliruptorales bacterium]